MVLCSSGDRLSILNNISSVSHSPAIIFISIEQIFQSSSLSNWTFPASSKPMVSRIQMVFIHDKEVLFVYQNYQGRKDPYKCILYYILSMINVLVYLRQFSLAGRMLKVKLFWANLSPFMVFFNQIFLWFVFSYKSGINPPVHV